MSLSKLAVGDTLPFSSLTCIDDTKIQLVNNTGLIHLMFRRFAGCPICSLHLRTFARGHGTLADAGITSAVIMHSSKELIASNQADWTSTFNFVSDPKKDLYTAIGAESAPSFWSYCKRNAKNWRLAAEIPRAVWRLMQGKRWGAEQGLYQIPADVLVDLKTGKVLAVHYGEDSNDQWSVEQVVEASKGIDKKAN